MSIVTQQLIGGGIPANPEPTPPRYPFSGTDATGENVEVGYGGYTYAKDTEQQELFGTTITRTGPQGDVVLNQSSESTQYGPDGRRMGAGEDQTTLLGQMAKMMGNGLSWSNDGGGKKMAYTFTNSDELISFRDHTTTGPQMTASGGYSGGFDADNNYGITNWISTGGTGIEAQEAVEEVTVPYYDPATGERNEATKGVDGRHKGNWDDANKGTFVIVEAADKIEAQQEDESFRAGGSNTGLRSLPDSGAQQSG